MVGVSHLRDVCMGNLPRGGTIVTQMYWIAFFSGVFVGPVVLVVAVFLGVVISGKGIRR